MLSVEKTSLHRLVEDGLEALMHAHWKECSIDQEEVPLDPDWAMAYAMESADLLHCFGLYRKEAFIGYSVFEVAKHLHFKSTRFAFNSGVYIEPKHRGLAGLVLAQRTEGMLKAMGVRKIVYLAPHGSALGGVLARAGYEPSEAYYTKLVD